MSVITRSSVQAERVVFLVAHVSHGGYSGLTVVHVADNTCTTTELVTIWMRVRRCCWQWVDSTSHDAANTGSLRTRPITKLNPDHFKAYRSCSAADTCQMCQFLWCGRSISFPTLLLLSSLSRAPFHSTSVTLIPFHKHYHGLHILDIPPHSHRLSIPHKYIDVRSRCCRNDNSPLQVKAMRDCGNGPHLDPNIQTIIHNDFTLTIWDARSGGITSKISASYLSSTQSKVQIPSLHIIKPWTQTRMGS